MSQMRELHAMPVQFDEAGDPVPVEIARAHHWTVDCWCHPVVAEFPELDKRVVTHRFDDDW